MENAVFIAPCQHGACEGCLNNSIIKVCPVCREDIDGNNRSKIFADRRTREIISNLIFKCDFVNCKETFKLCQKSQEWNEIK